MTAKKIIPIAILGYLAWSYFKKQTNRVQFGAVSTRVHKINIKGITLIASLPIINGSNITSTVQGFIGQLYHRSNPIGTITMPNAPVLVQAFKQTAVEFQIEIGIISGLQSFAPDIYSIITKPPSNIQDALALIDLKSLSIKGNLLIDGINADINQTLG